jgi:nitrogen-specific signal transduction histidine kinase
VINIVGALKLRLRSLHWQSVLLFSSLVLITIIGLITIMLIVASLVYPNHPSVPLLLVHVLFLLFLLGMMFFHDKHQIQQRLLHQRHIKAMPVMLSQNLPLIQTVDYSREAVIILDNTGAIIYSNPQSSLLLSLSESFLIDQPISNVLGILPNYDPINSPENGEFIWETQKKIVKYLRFRTQPLLDDDIPSGRLLTLFDISEEKKRSEANLQVAKFSVINEVSAGLAHEIRNPLTTIKGFMQLITPEQWPESFRPYQQLILDEIQSIDQVLSKFVLLTSPSAPQMQQLRLIETINATTQSIQPFRLRQGVTLILELSSPSVSVMGDHEQLLQALLSLLNNAIEASPKGGKVIIRLTEYESNARISVIDDGPGIPKNLRHRVLDPFFTTQADGTGLGLTIAQQIILAHHGKLHFSESLPPGGTEAMIDLPCLSKFTNSLSA